MVKSGFLFLAMAWGVGIVCAVIPGNLFPRVLSLLCFLVGAGIIFFFRDPPRALVRDERVIVSPADGRVLECTKEVFGDLGVQQVVRIFLSVANVHIQRSPLAGTVTGTERRAGAFLPAYRSDAHALNARNTILIQGRAVNVGVVQITGLIARRIECWVKPGQSVSQGEKIGFIRFGSQVDLYLPEGCAVRVKKGDVVRAGATPIALIP